MTTDPLQLHLAKESVKASKVLLNSLNFLVESDRLELNITAQVVYKTATLSKLIVDASIEMQAYQATPEIILQMIIDTAQKRLADRGTI